MHQHFRRRLNTAHADRRTPRTQLYTRERCVSPMAGQQPGVAMSVSCAIRSVLPMCLARKALSNPLTSGAGVVKTILAALAVKGKHAEFSFRQSRTYHDIPHDKIAFCGLGTTPFHQHKRSIFSCIVHASRKHFHTIEVELLKGIISHSWTPDSLVGCFETCCRSSGEH